MLSVDQFKELHLYVYLKNKSIGSGTLLFPWEKWELLFWWNQLRYTSVKWLLSGKDTLFSLTVLNHMYITMYNVDYDLAYLESEFWFSFITSWWDPVGKWASSWESLEVKTVW